MTHGMWLSLFHVSIFKGYSLIKDILYILPDREVFLGSSNFDTPAQFGTDINHQSRSLSRKFVGIIAILILHSHSFSSSFVSYCRRVVITELYLFGDMV